MREQHPVFDRDVLPDAVLWRYMDFPKFVSMLKEKALWFSRSDLLGDPLEGSFTQAREIERQTLLDNPPAGRSRKELEDVFRHNIRVNADSRQMLYINCWHLGSHESMALWQGYGGGPYAIAIRTTFGRLDKALPEQFSGTSVKPGGARAKRGDKPPRAMPIFLTQVRYIDHTSKTERLKDESNMLTPFVYKSLSYKHEQEVRALYWNIPAFESTGKLINPSGLFVPVDLRSLVIAVVISPLAPQWFGEIVEHVIRRYRFSFPIERSLTAAPPVL